MSVKEKRFIVVMLTDLDDFGFNEHTLPPLIRLMDAAQPDFRNAVHTGIVGYFLTSPDALNRIRPMIEFAAALRNEDKRFESLGIGLAEGLMIAEFTFWGRPKDGAVPFGNPAGIAELNAQEPDDFREVLDALSHKLGAHA